MASSFVLLGLVLLMVAAACAPTDKETCVEICGQSHGCKYVSDYGEMYDCKNASRVASACLARCFPIPEEQT